MFYNEMMQDPTIPFLILGIVLGMFVGAVSALLLLCWLERKGCEVRPLQKIPRHERRPLHAQPLDYVTARERLTPDEEYEEVTRRG